MRALLIGSVNYSEQHQTFPPPPTRRKQIKSLRINLNSATYFLNYYAKQLCETFNEDESEAIRGALAADRHKRSFQKAHNVRARLHRFES